MPKQLPPLFVQSRWHSEPVHMLSIEGSSFLKNQKGYPILSKAHQALIAKLMRLRTPPWILLCGEQILVTLRAIMIYYPPHVLQLALLFLYCFAYPSQCPSSYFTMVFPYMFAVPCSVVNYFARPSFSLYYQFSAQYIS